MEEVGEQSHKAVGRSQSVTGSLNVAPQVKNGSVEFAVAPEAEAIAIGVDQVREGLKLRPLLFVVRIAEAAGSAPLPGAFTSMKPIRAFRRVTA